MSRRLGIAIVFAITVLCAVAPCVRAQTLGATSSGQIDPGTLSVPPSQMGTRGTQYAMRPQGIGFCQAQCQQNDWQCLFDCLNPAGEAPTSPADPPQGPQVHCGPCRHGRMYCGVPGYGFSYVPCDCQTPACR